MINSIRRSGIEHHDAGFEKGLLNVIVTAFVCGLCGVELTDFLQELDESKFPRPWAADFETIPAGFFLRAKSDWTLGQMTGHIYANKEQGNIVVVRSQDYLLHEFDGTMREGARFGCCGYWPERGEINANCKNGHPIGTIVDECHIPHLHRLASDAVELVKVEVDD